MNKSFFLKVELETSQMDKSYCLAVYLDDEDHTVFAAADVTSERTFLQGCNLMASTVYDLLVGHVRAVQLLHEAESGSGTTDNQTSKPATPDSKANE